MLDHEASTVLAALEKGVVSSPWIPHHPSVGSASIISYQYLYTKYN